jgi:hypothetical protein
MKSPCEFSKLYKPAKTWEVINDNDPDLTPVYFSLPTPPKDLTLIDGYGLAPEDQYFRKQTFPKKLEALEDRALNALYEIEKGNRQDTIQGYKLYLKYWEVLEEDKDNLENEIQWLKKMWWHRTNGYWFYNDGQPTFLPPDYFEFLTFYYIAEAQIYPEYRDDVRRKYCYAWYLESATETFAKIDPESGLAKKEDDGHYEMTDLQRRVFFGDIEPKTRRTGASHEGISKGLKGTITNLSYHGTIISLEGDNAKALYEQKLLPAWDNYPMFLKPIWEGNRRPTSLKLSAPPNVYHVKGLNSMMTCTDSAGTKKNEGKRINYIHADEQGKNENSDSAERYHVNKLCMSTGMGMNIIKGAYTKNPSTVEEISAGGAQYYKMCMLSAFYKRLPIKGQTHEGLARIFLPAYLRLEGFIDRFGMSVIDTPTERQIKLSPNSAFAISKKGARQMMQAERDSLLAEGTPQAMEAYRSVRRKSPFSWAECWLGSSGNVGLNLEIIDKRLGEINRMKSFGKTPYRQGYLYRENGDLNGKVLWRDDNEKVKFLMSMKLPDTMTNQRVRCDMWDMTKNQFVPAWRPANGHRFTCGADPFRNITQNEAKLASKYGGSMSNSRQSDGGIAINWEYDDSIDKGKPRKEWESDRCILSYRYRPESQMEYMEDCLMAIQYFGAMLYPETNVERLVEHAIQRGYWGYLLYDIDILTGRPKAMPGRYTTGETQQELIVEAKDYIEFRGMSDCHDDLLGECKTLRGTEDLTHKDLFVAYFMSRLGSKSRHRDIISKGQSQQQVNLGNIGMFKKRRM